MLAKYIIHTVNKISFKYGSENEENYVFYIENNNIRYGNGEKDIKPSVELGNYVDGMFISLFEDGSFGNARALIIKDETLTEIEEEVESYSSKVEEHLKRMGFTW